MVSVRLTNKAWRVENLAPTQRLVLLCLADLAHPAAFTGARVDTIAERVGMTFEKTRDTLFALMSKRLISAEVQHDRTVFCLFPTRAWGGEG